MQQSLLLGQQLLPRRSSCFAQKFTHFLCASLYVNVIECVYVCVCVCVSVCKCAGKYIEAPLCAQIAFLAGRDSPFAFTFAFVQPPSAATGAERGRAGRQGRLAVGAGGEGAQNFRHQKELLSIITGLAPKELHFAGCCCCCFFYCLILFYSAL